MDFERLQSFVVRMKNTSSVTEKKKIIEETDVFVRQALRYTYDPYKRYNVTSKNCLKNTKLVRSNLAISPTQLFELLDRLSARVVTGKEAIIEVNTFVASFPKYAPLIYSILDKNLELRASDAIINNVIPHLIPTFDVALANNYQDKLCRFEKDTWYASRKLDGVRCILRKEGPNIIAYSRQGKEFATLNTVLEQLSKHGGDFVLDGEVCLLNEKGVDDFQGIMKEIKRKNHTIHNVKYIVFDHLYLYEFDGKRSTRKFSERQAELDALKLSETSQNVVQTLEQVPVQNNQHLNEMINDADARGFEGIMLRRDVAYEGKRTNNLLKCKTFHDAEYEVLDMDSENHRIVRDGREIVVKMMAHVWIEHKGNRVAVGSGWSQEDRIRYHACPNDIIGKTITVKYFEETTNQDGNVSLRFPTVKHVLDS